MSFLKKLLNLVTPPAVPGCSCGHDHAHTDDEPKIITKDMTVREVADRWPQTVTVFDSHDFDCHGGSEQSIEQTARSRGRHDIDSLLADLNATVKSHP